MDKTHLDTFRKIIGPAYVLTAAADMAAHESGWRGETGKAAAVLKPASTDEIAQILAYAHKHNIRLIPQGANTGLVGASIPDSSGTQGVINLDRLNGIITIDPINRTAHVQAGCRLSKLNAALEEHGLYFPVDLSADPSLGGMLSTNTGGGRLLKYGGVRENTLGLQAILMDGTTLDLLNALRKNNTGLDLKHLFIGTGGTFGIITDCILNLAPIPQQTATALLVPRTPESVGLLLQEIEKRCGTEFSAFEGMSGESIKRALAHAPTLTNPFGRDDIPPFTILLELTRTWAPREDEQPLVETLEKILSGLWELPEEPLENALLGDPKKLWALRHGLSEGVQKSGKLIAFDISFRRGDIMPFLMRMKKQLPDRFPNIAICDFGHIGDGGVHFNLVLDKSDARLKNPEFETELRTWVYDIVVKDYKGSFSAEHGIGPKNAAFYERYTPEDVKRITRAIQNAL